MFPCRLSADSIALVRAPGQCGVAGDVAPPAPLLAPGLRVASLERPLLRIPGREPKEPSETLPLGEPIRDRTSGHKRRDGRNLQELFFHVHDARNGPRHLGATIGMLHAA